MLRNLGNILIKGKKGLYNSRLSQGDAFYRLFLSDSCLGKACYDKCKFKYDKSSADIRIGDLWGKTYQKNEDGVSAAIAFTSKGDEVLQQCNCTLVEHPFEVVAEGQMKTCPKRTTVNKKIMKIVANNTPMKDLVSRLSIYQKRERWTRRLSHPMQTINHLLKRIF